MGRLARRAQFVGWCLAALCGVAAAQERARAPVPDGPALAAAGKDIAGAYRQALADKSPSGRKALARKLLADLEDPAMDATTRYAMLGLASSLAKDACDVETAWLVVDAVEQAYVVDASYAVTQRADFLAALADKAPPTEGPALAARGVEFVEQCVVRGDLEIAVRLQKGVQSVTTKSGDEGLKARWLALKPDLAEYQQKAKPALETLKSSPASEKANLDAGTWTVFSRGDFEAGLPYLARSADGKLKELALADLARPTDASAQAALGGRWLEFSAGQKGKPKVLAMARGLAWLQAALPGLKNADKLAVKNQVEALEGGELREAIERELLPADAAGQSSATDRQARKAVDAGLAWLARHQDDGGGWTGAQCSQHCPAGHPCQPQTGVNGAYTSLADVGVTSLALLAYLRAGYGDDSARVIDDPLHKRSRIVGKDIVAKGLKWLVKRQQPDGSFTGDGRWFLYNEAIATLALAKAYALTRNEAWKLPAQKAVDYLCRAQKPHPTRASARWGWRYVPGPVLAPGVLPQDLLATDSDMSVTGWAVMALKTAQLGQLKVPEAALAGALEYATFCTAKDNSGFVGYRDPVAAGGDVEGERYGTFAYHWSSMSAIGMCVRFALEHDPREPALQQAADVLLKDLPGIRDQADRSGEQKSGVDYYCWYYGSLALSQFDGPDVALRSNRYWVPWKKALEDTLLALQDQTVDACSQGGWMTPDRWAYGYGPVYTTAINAQSLEICSGYAVSPGPKSLAGALASAAKIVRKPAADPPAR